MNDLQELRNLAAKQKDHDKWLLSLIAYYQAKIEIYKLMVKEWEDQLSGHEE